MFETIEKVHQVAQITDAIWRKNASESGVTLTPAQARILGALSAKTPINQTEIVRVTGIDRSTIAEIIRRLHADKLIVRTRDKSDRRSMNTTITPAGAEALAKAKKIAKSVTSQLPLLVSGLDGVSIKPEAQQAA